MRSFVIVAALVGCTESDADRLADLEARSTTSCWTYFGCENGGQGPASAGPKTPVEQGASCMNDAIAGGTTAMAAWGYDEFNPWDTRETYVFAVDHQVRVFVSVAQGVDAPQVRELHGCMAPFAVESSALCGARSPGDPQVFVDVYPLAWGGCSEP